MQFIRIIGNNRRGMQSCILLFRQHSCFRQPLTMVGMSLWEQHHLAVTRRPPAASRSMMSLSAPMEKRLQLMRERHNEILDEMKQPGVTSANLGKELATLKSIVTLLEERDQLDEEETSLTSFLEEAQDDKDMREECLAEIQRVERRRAGLDEQLLDAALPQDEDDHTSDTIIEVRAGTGGDEASLFAAELLECYARTAKTLRWKVEMLSESKTDIGGIREASLSVVAGKNAAPYTLHSTDGDPAYEISLGPYGTFKFESGVHRVQRVPVNDTRIHTSACSVAVLPSLPQDDADDSEFLPLSELRIETMRASGAGGQHINTTDSAVRITHLPTKITASIQDERSQHKNKEKAMRLIAARVREHRRAEEERALGETRSSLMGGGNRSERIRTYNFPQDRVTNPKNPFLVSNPCCIVLRKRASCWPSCLCCCSSIGTKNLNN